MTYADAKLCLPPKAKLHSREPEGELWFVGRQAWWLTEDATGWNCTKGIA